MKAVTKQKKAVWVDEIGHLTELLPFLITILLVKPQLGNEAESFPGYSAKQSFIHTYI